MQRNTQTKNKIKQALVQLLNKKNLEEITVSDITRHSQINRGTFYLHYLDKYDLIEKLEEDILTNIQQIFDQPVEKGEENPLIPDRLILNALYYVKDDLAFIKALVEENGDPKFVSTFKKLLTNTVKKYIAHEKNQLPIEKIPNDYAEEILLSSTISILLLWMKKGGEESPELLLTYINYARDTSPTELLQP
ncbi:MAG: TetR/AcrR family transcriptional regulator [Tetragenococcus koreensis]|uniref:TetR/AcrR family transcriptional regulator n=1 Tax=Tetragenococcus halophilus TaxID=51669 RepID=UPI001F16964F|nr:TetR/AcrR family transcriptional regulator [Tetragenococcus halophilus]MDN6140260.1 TetR/AcrR family transcriptional regulator [Tetragenococcus koreensis]MCF1602023.1 TetR/AcrR family transcriptional regulator [Tetragenococcus halophilus]MCO8289508.1 TetR/AcrR family transcriptional regulator [Tetragenococcus halophilus]MCO8291132.1 TetR/AcrR family transcriptional regulator [Tetragenococcus halophilus]MDN6112443.1 TetR/AcrR family transcriptional regulator [Tetragenococcus halophilus]